jgi:predicted transglutaminase-like cysteine proteinase
MRQHGTLLRWRRFDPRWLVAIGALLALGACAAGTTAAEPRIAQASAFDGSETFLASTSPVPQWAAVIERYDRTLRSPAAVPAEWHRLVNGLSGLDLAQKIERANIEINRHPYVPSARNWGRPDYWETPFEFLAKNGQCQDYAIAKYFLLRAAGVPTNALRVVIVQDTESRSAHAVVVVDPQGQALMLDNQITGIVPFATADRYQPLYALNEDGWWVFRARTAPVWPARYAQAAAY